MKSHQLLLFAFSFLIFASACCKDNNERTLPPETQNGYNTYGCRINGKVWLPQATPFTAVALVARANKSTLSIGANQGVAQTIGVTINDEIVSNKTYIINSDKELNAFYNFKCDKGTFCYYQTNSKYSAEITITRFDTINRIVAGRFAFKVALIDSQNTDCNCDTSIINITDGRFDLQYLPIQ